MAKKKIVSKDPLEVSELPVEVEDPALAETEATKAVAPEGKLVPGLETKSEDSDDALGELPPDALDPEDLDIPDIVAVELDLPKSDTDMSYDLTLEEMGDETPLPEETSIQGETLMPEDPPTTEETAIPGERTLREETSLAEDSATVEVEPESIEPDNTEPGNIKQDGLTVQPDAEAEADPPPESAPQAKEKPAAKRAAAKKVSAPPDPESAAPEPDARRTFYQLDFHELDRGLSPEQRQEWNSIYASYRGRSVMTGTVVGIDRHAISVRDKRTGEMVRQEMYCAIVIPFRVRIVIPETEMWLAGEEKPGFVLRNIVGASIDFVVIHVDRESGFAIGSRRLALRSRRYYFSTQPSLNREGSRVKCRTLAVGPRRCLICCYGYDINLTQRDMRYTAIPDLRDEYHPGQELDCIVKRFDREEGTLVVSVKETNPNPFDGAHLRHPEGSRRQGIIAGKYAGGVFCNLPDGVVVMCSYSFQYNDAAFAIGDKVILTVQRYDFEKKQTYGKIVAKW